MFRSSRTLAASAFLIFFAGPSWTQPLTLAEAQRLAVAGSEQLTAIDAAAQANRELAVSAGQLPDPVLTLGVENVPLSGPERFSLTKDFMTMRQIGLMQELTRSDKRRLKVERVQREGARLLAERQAARAEIQRETALAWIEAAYTFAMQELLKEQLVETSRQVEAAEIAFRSGRGNQADVFGARANVANLEDRMRRLERQARSARLMLARWTGAEAAQRPLVGSVDWRNSAVEKVITSVHLLRHPRLAALEAQVRAAETEVKQAQANTRADWTVQAMYGRRGPAFSDMLSISVSVPLQLDRANRQDREVAARLAMLAEARAKLQDALRAEEAAVRVLLNDWSTGKLRLDRLTADLLPAAKNRTEAALASYRAGKADLTTAVAARREEIEARLQLLELEMEVARLWAQLNYLTADPAVAGHQE